MLRQLKLFRPRPRQLAAVGCLVGFQCQPNIGILRGVQLAKVLSFWLGSGE